LLLDEPTNHLDLATIEWLEGELQRTKSALIMISHDRRFLERVSRATVWLDRGTTRRLDKGFAHFEEWRDRLLEEEELEQHKLGRQIEREEHWLRYGVTARRKRNMRRLGELHSMRERFRGRRGPEGVASMSAAEGAESGKLVIEARNIAKSFGDRAVVQDFSTRIQRGDRVGLVGPNGAGKTTLLKMLIGTLEPDAGSVRLGANLEIAALDQKRELDPSETLAHYLTDGRGDSLVVNGEEKHVVSYMKDFLFKPEQARTPVRELSGGERARLVLARILARPANLLVLDEPTNDLDMDTLDKLEELLESYDGTLILVSHDRDFVDRLATSTIAMNGRGQIVETPGGWTDFIRQNPGFLAPPPSPLPSRGGSSRSDGSEAAPAPALSAPKKSAKLSFKDTHRLKELEGLLESLPAVIAKHDAALADPDLYSRDPKAFDRAMTGAAQAREQLEVAELEWLELEEKKASLGA
ncbi:MAG: ABC-F family ATP-binding cassette domain-containing protein, partial [Brevundimonas sp.]|uniref:ABC-F family ATP-binding cassette domain-containing protein n=1 Tax=Brevundimonas sp. TaxID=1871086 RepID=UPI004034A899